MIKAISPSFRGNYEVDKSSLKQSQINHLARFAVEFAEHDSIEIAGNVVKLRVPEEMEEKFEKNISDIGINFNKEA
ncbi:MAG: hypothetical protein PHV68_09510 [Candidatus Gastranaerophilales bacterium]|nr:hypothetical protein [Candidatus Gastranaerophilales bacterium]